MPIHDVGYRRWNGVTTSLLLRWLVVAGAGIRLVWKSHWLRRMLFFAWLPAAVTGVGFFIYEQSLERQEWKQAIPYLIEWYPESRLNARSEIAANVKRAFEEDGKTARHQIWSLLLLVFFRNPQGLLMVLLVGMIAPSLISLDFRSRAYLLYFSRPLTPGEYILGKALVVWTYLAAVTTLPALALYVLGVLLSPDISVVLDTWDLPLRILLASLVLMLPTTSLALFFSSLTTESRYAGFAWFALWGLGWAAYESLGNFTHAKQWSLLSLYHVLGCVQEWVFKLSTFNDDVSSAATLLLIVTVMPFIVLVSRVAAPMRI